MGTPLHIRTKYNNYTCSRCPKCRTEEYRSEIDREFLVFFFTFTTIVRTLCTGHADTLIVTGRGGQDTGKHVVKCYRGRKKQKNKKTTTTKASRKFPTERFRVNLNGMLNFHLERSLFFFFQNKTKMHSKIVNIYVCKIILYCQITIVHATW